MTDSIYEHNGIYKFFDEYEKIKDNKLDMVAMKSKLLERAFEAGNLEQLQKMVNKGYLEAFYETNQRTFFDFCKEIIKNANVSQHKNRLEKLYEQFLTLLPEAKEETSFSQS